MIVTEGMTLKAIKDLFMDDAHDERSPGNHVFKKDQEYITHLDHDGKVFVVDSMGDDNHVSDWDDIFIQVKDPADIVKPSGGGNRNHYDLPEGAEQLQDLIEYRNMNGSVKDIFKACYRLGLKEGTSDIYDVEKIVFYSLRELGRLQGRKDYLTIAKEVIGHQAKEN